MIDDYLDRIAELMPADALESYVEIKERIFAQREQLRLLESELVDLGRQYGVPDIDSSGTESNRHIAKALDASSMELNSIWVSTPSSWTCPCCGRSKAECARLGASKQLLGKLVAHHDHIEDFTLVVLSDLSNELMIEAASAQEAEQFMRRGMALFSRFDRVVICEDCNNAEANAKKAINAARYFTFTPREIASFLIVSPNQRHDVDKDSVAAAYSKARPLYERRIASLKRLAEHALRGTAWYEPVAFDDLEDQVSRRACQALHLFGIHDAGYWTIRDMFVPSGKIDAKHAPAWRQKTTSTSRMPNENEIEYAIRGNEQYERLPVDWTCLCCRRPKRDTIRWSQNSKRFIFRLHTRNVADDLHPYGRRKIEICDACGHIFKECGKEMRTTLDRSLVPEYPVDIEDVRAIIRPTPYSMHEVDTDAAKALVETLLSRFDNE